MGGVANMVLLTINAIKVPLKNKWGQDQPTGDSHQKNPRDVPSVKRLHSYAKSPCLMGNQLFLWPFSYVTSPDGFYSDTV